LRIAILSWESLHSIAVGGLAAHVTGLSETLHRLGHEVHVFTRMGPGQLRYDCINGVHYHRCPFEHQSEFLSYVSRMCEAFVARFRAAEDFYGRPFDIVHGHDWLASEALERIKHQLHRPIVLTIHSTEYGRCGNAFIDGLSRRIRDLEYQATAVADGLICVSKALAKEVEKIYRAPAEKISVLYNGIDLARFDAPVDAPSTRARIGIASDDPLVLFVGRLAWQKGPDLLISAAPHLLDYCSDAKVVFVGDGEMRPALERAAMEARLFNVVRFLGYRNGTELVELFKSADVICVPSRNEPFGIVVLEAWGATKPVVVTPNGGPSEFVRDQETGLIVRLNEESIAWGLGTALADADNATRIARNGRHEAETHFSWDSIADGTLELYHSLRCAQSRSLAH
jgi:glycosyltransferase involved in cell wall biosynthesis